jgi:hypothetical protein
MEFPAEGNSVNQYLSFCKTDLQFPQRQASACENGRQSIKSFKTHVEKTSFQWNVRPPSISSSPFDKIDKREIGGVRLS